MTAIRGGWNLDKAIVARWAANSLDTDFRGYWTDAAITQYPVFHQGEARPEPPGPYCVFDHNEPVIEAHMTGATSSTEKQFQRIPVSFRVHAKSSASLTGYAICQALIQKVAEAYDDPSSWTVDDDAIVQVIRGPDWWDREGDEEWSWTLMYDFIIDATYDTV